MTQLAAQPHANGNGLAAPDKRMSTFKGLFDASRAQIAAVLPKHLTPERIMKVALVAISRTPKLQECSPMSVLQSVMTAAQLGLDCGGVMGQGYLVPYWNKKTGSNECQFIPGYRGLIDLARRSGQVTSIESRSVYERDSFDWVCGLNPVLAHKPFLDGDAGQMRLVYAIAHFKDDAGTHYEVMTTHEINRIRDASPAGKFGPWVDHYEEMAKKTVIRRLCKYLPMSIELAAAMEVGDTVDRGITADVLDGMVVTRDEQAAEDAPPQDRAAALVGRIAAKPVDSRPVEPNSAPEPVKQQQPPPADDVPKIPYQSFVDLLKTRKPAEVGEGGISTGLGRHLRELLAGQDTKGKAIPQLWQMLTATQQYGLKDLAEADEGFPWAKHYL